MSARAYLFVPGDRPDRFDKAAAAGADAVILDLEDAVEGHAKPQARRSIIEWARAGGALDAVWVRINAAGSEDFAEDLTTVARARIMGVVLSKTESAAHVAAVRGAVPQARVLALIESARGVLALRDICGAEGVVRLGFGSLDYANDLGLSGDERGLIEPASRMALASRVAGIGSPVAGVTTALDDPRQLQADLDFARAMGFGAKLCIHPKQVAAVRAAFAPTDAEVDWARRVVAATAGGAGAVQVDGRMVDRPVLLKARDILERAGG